MTDLAIAFSIIILLAELFMEPSFSLYKMNGIANYLSWNDLGPGTAEANMNRARKHYLSKKCRASSTVT